jgi:hypothetical protein
MKPCGRRPWRDLPFMQNDLAIAVVAIVFTALSAGILYWVMSRRNEPIQPTVVPAEQSLGVNHDEDRLLFGRPEAPLVEFEPIQLVPDSKSLGSNAHLTAVIGPLIELIPKTKEMVSPAMRVVFSKEVMRGLKDGTLELTKDGAGDFLAVARKVDSKDFFQHGRLLKGGVKVATLASASLQIATLITAQAHLAEIKASLKNIEDRLEKIAFFQREEKRAQLRGAVQLLQQYSRAIARGDLTEQEAQAIITKLEDIEETCLSIAELGKGLLEKEKEALTEIRTREITDPKRTVADGKQWTDNCRELIELITMSHSCRILGAYVKSTLEGGTGLVNERIADSRMRVDAVLELFTNTKDGYSSHLVRPLEETQKNWFLHPFGWDPFGRKEHVPEALANFQESQTKASKIVEGFALEATQVLKVVVQQEEMAQKGFEMIVRSSESGAVEVVKVSTT